MLKSAQARRSSGRGLVHGIWLWDSFPDRTPDDVFVVGLPAKILAGFVMVMLTFPVSYGYPGLLMERLFGYLDNMILILGK